MRYDNNRIVSRLRGPVTEASVSTRVSLTALLYNGCIHT